MLLWKQTSVDVQLKKLPGAVKRKTAGWSSLSRARRIKGVQNMLLGGSGFFIDKLEAVTMGLKSGMFGGGGKLTWPAC